MPINSDYYSPIRIVWRMLCRRKTSTRISLLMLLADTTLVRILSTILSIVLLIVKHLEDELNSVQVEEFVGLRPKCYAFMCTGKVDKNVLKHVEPVEEKTAKGVKRKVKDDHLRFGHCLDVLRSFESPLVGLTVFDTKRWLCDDTIHTHSYGHRDTVEKPKELEKVSFIT